MSDNLSLLLEGPRQFAKDSVQLVERCTKPDRKGISFNMNPFVEFTKISQAVATGFLIMGFIGFFVKLVHIPINNIIVYVFLGSLKIGEFNKGYTR
jgi:protein transport protein SEC61 subunit gamma-like protein